MEHKDNDLFKALANFPKEEQRKENIIKCLNDLLFNIGSFLNDNNAKLERVTVDGKDCMKYTDTYGEHVQSIAGDDPKALFFDTFKMLLKYNREMQGAYEYFIKPYIEPQDGEQ